MTKIDLLTDSLRTGRDNAISWQSLARIIGVSDRRAVYETIATAREQGFIILPDNKGGYFLGETETAEGRAEIERFIKRGHNEAIAILTTLKSARLALKDCEDNNI